MSKIVVTGGAGFIGSHIVDALVERGADVVVIDDLSSGHEQNIKHHGDAITFVKASITDYDVVRDACTGADTIIHHAAVASVQKSIEDPIGTHDVNVTGTLNVLEAAREHNVSRVIYTSTSAVYGNDPVLPKTENMKLAPLSPYALHKCMNEQYARLYSELYGLTTIGFRYFNVFGPRQDPSSDYSGVISIFANRIPKEQSVTIFGDGTTTRDFVYVDDVVQANIHAVDSNLSGALVFNIARGEQTSLLDLVAGIESACGKSADVSHGDPREGEVRHSLADISEARNGLDFEPRTGFADGIRLTIESF